MRTFVRTHGMRTLLRLHLRTGRGALVGWPALWATLVLAMAASTVALYPSQADREEYAATMGLSRMQEAFNGRAYDVATAGGIAAFEVGMFGMLAIPVGASLMAIARTRAEESRGRWDIVTAGSHRRTAPVAAAALALLSMVLAFGVVSCAGFVLLGLPASGSIAYAIALTLYALAFAAFGLLVAQIVSDERVAVSVSLSVILSFFLLRALIDGRHLHATWATPMGWLAEARPWGQGRAWPYLAYAFAIAATSWWAVRLAARRDLGDGMIRAKPGHSTASPHLAGLWSWTWRLARGGVFGWSLGAIGLGVVMASMGEEMRHLVDANPSLAVVLGGRRAEDFLTRLTVVTLALFSLVSGLAMLSRLRAEERSGRLGLVAASPVTRGRLWWVWLASAGIGSMCVLLPSFLLYGWVLRLASGASGDVASSAAVTSLAVLAVVALAGIHPRLLGVGWILVAWAGVVGLLADALRLPGWTRRISPLDMVGDVPVDDPRWGVVVGLAVAIPCMVTTGCWINARRDLTAG